MFMICIIVLLLITKMIFVHCVKLRTGKKKHKSILTSIAILIEVLSSSFLYKKWAHKLGIAL